MPATKAKACASWLNSGAWTVRSTIALVATATAGLAGPLTEALPVGAELPPPPPSRDQLVLMLFAVSGLLFTGLANLFRHALLRGVPQRTLALLEPSPRRERLAGLLEENDRLSISAGLLTLIGQFVFAYAILALLGGGTPVRLEHLSMALLIAVPPLALVCEGIARALAASPIGDRLLRSWLGAFYWIQLPLAPISIAILGTERRARALFDLPDASAPRRLVEGLRTAIEDSPLHGNLGETEREIIENALWFADVDAAAIMSPRTEIQGVNKQASLREALQLASDCAHSRLPVFDENLDAVIGVFSVRDGAQAAAERKLDDQRVDQRMRPAWFVPETVRVSELLRGFRERKLEMAIVLDEYGGTAGLLTLSDILSELVGELHDEHDKEEPAAIRPAGHGLFDVDASTRVGEVNEELDVDLPEVADYETLAGFVLARLGRFPAIGEQLEHAGAIWTVTHASDRRVQELRVQLPAHTIAARASRELADRAHSDSSGDHKPGDRTARPPGLPGMTG